MQNRLQFRLDPGRTALKLAWIGLALLGAHMLISWLWAEGGPEVVDYGYVDMFDLDEEEGFGTWFAAVTLLITGRLLLVVARDSRRAADGLWGYWLVLAIGFHFLSVDEIAGMHEWVNTYGEAALGLEAKWTTYAMVVVGIVAAAYIPFLVFLLGKGHRRTVLLFSIAALLYVGGAVGTEKLSPDEGFSTLSYNLMWISIEEGLEMAGVILMIYAVLDYLRGRPGNRLRMDVYTQSSDPAQDGAHDGVRDAAPSPAPGG